MSFFQRKVRYYVYDYIVPKQSKLLEFGQSFILTDDIEPKPINPNNQFNFGDYCKAIVSIINGTSEKCSIGIYGKWGTGKTTLMKLVEANLKPQIFCWK
ncbi:MAG: P-loop NTPase fold protein [Candidatus Nitrosopolaris sp.]